MRRTLPACEVVQVFYIIIGTQAVNILMIDYLVTRLMDQDEKYCCETAVSPHVTRLVKKDKNNCRETGVLSPRNETGKQERE